jgi:negative regulator of sigma E activity
MDYEAQLKLQAFLDGELPEAEARQVANRLAQDQEASALLAELRQTRQALAGFETGTRLPESREFYWSKIQREIERLEPPAATPAATPLLARLRRLFVPATAALLAVLAGVVMLGPRPAAAPELETAVSDTGAFTYHDYSAGATLIWLSYPSENEIAQNDEDDLL